MNLHWPSLLISFATILLTIAPFLPQPYGKYVTGLGKLCLAVAEFLQ